MGQDARCGVFFFILVKGVVGGDSGRGYMGVEVVVAPAEMVAACMWEKMDTKLGL